MKKHSHMWRKSRWRVLEMVRFLKKNLPDIWRGRRSMWFSIALATGTWENHSGSKQKAVVHCVIRDLCIWFAWFELSMRPWQLHRPFRDVFAGQRGLHWDRKAWHLDGARDAAATTGREVQGASGRMKRNRYLSTTPSKSVDFEFYLVNNLKN